MAAYNLQITDASPVAEFTPKFPVLSYNFGDPYAAEMTQRQELSKKNRRPDFALSPDVNCLKGLDVQALNESLLMSETEINMLQDIFIPKELPKHSYPCKPPTFKDDYEDIDVTLDVDLTPEPIKAKNAVVLTKPEPWSEVVFEESHPSNVLYEKAYKEQNISSQPFDDPIKITSELLLPTIVSEFPLKRKPRSIGLRNIKASPLEVTLPDPLTYPYLLALHEDEQSDEEKYETASPSGKTRGEMNETLKTEAEDHSPAASQGSEQDVSIISARSTGGADKIDSIVHGTEMLSVDDKYNLSAIEIVEPTEGSLEAEVANIKELTVALTGFKTDTYDLLKSFLISTWESLLKVQVPSLPQLTQDYDNPIELDPSVTAQWVHLIDNEDHNESRELIVLRASLLGLHGAVVGFDTFKNLDFELAFEYTTDFYHEFKSDLPYEFEEFVQSLVRSSSPRKRKETHPKLKKLVERLLDLLDSTIENVGLVWICLHRYPTDLAGLIYEHFVESGIDCTVDPVIFRPKKEKQFQVQQPGPPIIIAEVMPKDFPPSKISLILHYEPPPQSWKRANKLYNSVTQEVLITCLPSDETQDVEMVDPLSTSSKSTCSSGSSTLPLPSDKGTPCSKPRDEHNADVIILDAEESATPVAKANHLHSPRRQGASANPADALAQSEYSCSIIVASHLKRNSDFMEAMHSIGDLCLYEYDYRCLKDVAKYQPDIVLSAEAAVLIYQPEAGEEFAELRMKLLSTSLKCTRCWVIVLCPGCRSSGRMPPDWHSLNSASHYHARKVLRSEIDLRFAVIPSLAFNYGHLAAIIKDVATNESGSDVKLPTGHDIERLLRVPHLNVVTAQLVARAVSPDEFFSLPLKKLLKKLMKCVSENVCLRVIAYHESKKPNPTQRILENMRNEPDTSFGKIENNLESSASPRLAVGQERRLPKPDQTSHTADSIDVLREIWTSPERPSL